MERTQLKVRALGGLTLTFEGEAVDAGDIRSKGWLMLAYLICNRSRTVSREELIQLLSDDTGGGDPVRMLRNARWSVRRALEPISGKLGCDLLVGSGGSFGLNPELDVLLDTEELEALCRGKVPHEERRGRLLEATKLYRGAFLPMFDGVYWVSTLSAYYQNLYLDAVRELLPLLGPEDASLGVSLCRDALRAAPYDEPLCRALMGFLTALGDAAGADEVYRRLRRDLTEELGVLPEPETAEIHRRAVSRSGTLEPDALHDLLREPEAAKGAMICDYEAFRLLYWAEARSAGRRGDAIHIALLTVTGRRGKPLPKRSLSWAMGELERLISTTLRSGDVAASCSASQYLVMLLQANEENARMACDRVIRAFERTHPSTSARVNAVVLPLEPLQTLTEGRLRSNWAKQPK